jgi:bidirectional [NiFe] hydrogenase diaphorase subunit
VTTASAAAKTLSPEERRQRLLDAALRRNQHRQDALIEVLHTAQNTYGYLTPEVLWYVARQLRLPPSRVYGVATFYNFFSLKPPGEHTCVVCAGTVCYIRGAARIAAAVGEAFAVEPGKTSADGKVSLGIARCLGSCGLAPVVVVDGQVAARVTPEAAVESVRSAIAGAVQPAVGAGSPA